MKRKSGLLQARKEQLKSKGGWKVERLEGWEAGRLVRRKKGQTYTLDRPDGYDIHPSFLLLSAA